jgi:hypothetical protein
MRPARINRVRRFDLSCATGFSPESPSAPPIPGAPNFANAGGVRVDPILTLHLLPIKS